MRARIWATRWVILPMGTQWVPTYHSAMETNFDSGAPSAAFTAAAGSAGEQPAGAESAAGPLEVDARVAHHLLPGERVLEQVSDTTVILVGDGAQTSEPRSGTVFLTDRRVIHVNDEVVLVELADVLEQTTAGNRLLITLEGARGVMLDLESPNEFRGRLAAAVSALRAQMPSR